MATIIICEKIPTSNPLRLFIEGLNKYTIKDKKYTIIAIAITTKRFGPSGSLKNTNITLDNKIAVTANITNGNFFDWKDMIVIIL
jgi:hypothetical protein